MLLILLSLSILTKYSHLALKSETSLDPFFFNGEAGWGKATEVCLFWLAFKCTQKRKGHCPECWPCRLTVVNLCFAVSSLNYNQAVSLFLHTIILKL